MTNALPTLIAIGGWIGAAEFLVGYLLVSRGRLAGDSLRYQALNITGAVLLMTNCAYTGAWPSAISNVFYLGVGLTIVLTVKRAYLGQLAHRQRVEMGHRLARGAQTARCLSRAASRATQPSHTVGAAPTSVITSAALR